MVFLCPGSDLAALLRCGVQAMIEDLLTIRADRDNYYYGCDALFGRHPEIIHRLCAWLATVTGGGAPGARIAGCSAWLAVGSKLSSAASGADAPTLLPTLLDGLVWRSRIASGGAVRKDSPQTSLHARKRLHPQMIQKLPFSSICIHIYIYIYIYTSTYPEQTKTCFIVAACTCGYLFLLTPAIFACELNSQVNGESTTTSSNSDLQIPARHKA